MWFPHRCVAKVVLSRVSATVILLTVLTLLTSITSLHPRYHQFHIIITKLITNLATMPFLLTTLTRCCTRRSSLFLLVLLYLLLILLVLLVPLYLLGAVHGAHQPVRHIGRDRRAHKCVQDTLPLPRGRHQVMMS